MSRLLNLTYRLSEKYIRFSLIGIATGISMPPYVAHTFLLDKYAELFQFYSKGFPLDVPDSLQSLLKNISDDLAIPIITPLTKLFHTIGFETFHFGSTGSNNGCRIGIPISFTYNTKDDVDRSAIRVDNKPVQWNSSDGELLLDSIVMSDSAKKFGIAYELALLDTSILKLHSCCFPASVVFCSFVNNFFCNAYGLMLRPTRFKIGFYSLLIVFGIGASIFARDLVTQYFELEANERVASGGKEYITGGIEFYDKVLARNRALRNLLPDGKSYFNTYGDEVFLFRQKHISIRMRQKQLVQLLKEKEAVG